MEEKETLNEVRQSDILQVDKAAPQRSQNSQTFADHQIHGCDCCVIAFSECVWAANQSSSSWLCLSQENACCHAKDAKLFICYKLMACKPPPYTCNNYRQCFNVHCFSCHSRDALKNMDKIEPKLGDTGRGHNTINYETVEGYAHLSCGGYFYKLLCCASSLIDCCKTQAMCTACNILCQCGTDCHPVCLDGSASNQLNNTEECLVCSGQLVSLPASKYCCDTACQCCCVEEGFVVESGFDCLCIPLVCVGYICGTTLCSCCLLYSCLSGSTDSRFRIPTSDKVRGTRLRSKEDIVGSGAAVGRPDGADFTTV